MMRDNLVLPDDCRLSCSVFTSKFDLDMMKYPGEYMANVDHNLRKSIEQAIADKKIVQIETPEMVERRIDLIVMEPKDFFRLVNKHAQSLADRMTYLQRHPIQENGNAPTPSL